MPKTITLTTYKLEELSTEVQEKLIQKRVNFNNEYMQLDLFEDDSQEFLSTQGFEKPELNYSLNCSQGDGLSFSAGLDETKLKEIISEIINNNKLILAKNKEKAIKQYLANITIDISAEKYEVKGRYCYAHRHDVSMDYLESEIYYEGEEYEYKNKKGYIFNPHQHNVIARDILTKVRDHYIECCKYLEKLGYEYIEDATSEETAKEELIQGDSDYLADGTIL